VVPCPLRSRKSIGKSFESDHGTGSARFGDARRRGPRQSRRIHHRCRDAAGSVYAIIANRNSQRGRRSGGIDYPCAILAVLAGGRFIVGASRRVADEFRRRARGCACSHGVRCAFADRGSGCDDNGGSASATTLGASAPAAASGNSSTVTTAATNAANGAAASSVNAATAIASLAQPTATAAITTANASSANAASAASPGALTVAAQLQTPNSSLAALGLSPSDIQKVDQIAGLINDFNPTSFTSLVYQLEALAQNVAPQTTQTPAASDSTASAAAGPQPAATAATPAATSAANAGLTNANSGNFVLQGVQLQLTFANDNGQTVQVQSTNASSVRGQTNAATA
jgi:hypothetical protein